MGLGKSKHLFFKHLFGREQDMNLIERAVTKRQFSQIAYMSEGRFDSFLSDRGLRVGITGIRSLVASGVLQELKTESGHFHPFQIWPIRMLVSRLEFRMDAGISYHGFDSAGIKHFIDLSWDIRANALTSFPKDVLCIEFNRKLFPLLLWLESYFLPVIRGPRPGIVHFVGLDSIDEWSRWAESLQGMDLLHEHSISIEQLSAWRERILFDASQCDPSPDLYLLFRSMPFEQRNRLKGRLRLAYDLYEMTEVIRLLLERVTDKPVTKEWDPNGHPSTPWVERVYGSQPQFGDPGFLRPLIRHYGLDPAFRVKWLVEGQTEEGFILQYVERLGANIGGFVTIREFGGDGAFQKESPAIDADLKAAKEEQCFVTLTFDESRGTRRRLENLIESGLVNCPFVLNSPDFECGNFTIGQLVAVAVSWASELGCPVKLSQESLIEKVEWRLENKQEDFKKALNAVLRSGGEVFRLSKGAEWGRRLADSLCDKRGSEAQEGTYSEQTLTKIERQIRYTLRNSQPFIDYPLSVENLDNTALEIV